MQEIPSTPILTSAETRAHDARAIDHLGIPSLVLMENAARGAWEFLVQVAAPDATSRIVVLCGSGNNGGDGLALARHALIFGANVQCILLKSPEEFSTDAAAQYKILAALGGQIAFWEDFASSIGSFDIIVDALLGTGSAGAPRGNFDAAIRWMNAQDSFRFALDIPSGLNADTGLAEGIVVEATATATMAALKPGLLLNRGPEVSGVVRVVHIGVPETVYSSTLNYLGSTTATALLPEVKHSGNKYDRGKVLILAGSRGMTGAGVLASEAALRAGAGLVVLGLPEDAAPIKQSVAPEIMSRFLVSGSNGSFSKNAFDELRDELGSYKAIIIGPGLTKNKGAMSLVQSIILAANMPVVLDADGLSAYAGNLGGLARRGGNLVLTPHYGEMARLSGWDKNNIAADPVGAAISAASIAKCVVVLKGAPTVVALPDGRVWINGAGNPGMATGGTGDVLAGMVGSLIAQTGSVERGTLAAVYLHSHAADLAVAETTMHSLVASDIIRCIASAYRDLEGN